MIESGFIRDGAFQRERPSREGAYLNLLERGFQSGGLSERGAFREGGFQGRGLSERGAFRKRSLQ